jgi:hypothetical protein
MQWPKTTTRGLMLAVAGTGVVCAVFTYESFAGLMLILPLIGAFRGAARSPRRISAAVQSAVIWGAVQAGVLDVLLAPFLLKDPPLALFNMLIALEISLLIGLAAGVFVGAGFLLSGPVRPYNKMH